MAVAGGCGGGGRPLSLGVAGSEGGRQRHGLQSGGEEGGAAEEDVVGIHALRQLLRQLPFIHLPPGPTPLLLGAIGINDVFVPPAYRTFIRGLC